MERLTEYHLGIAVIKDKNKLHEAMQKLAAYEDTEEKGLLLRLPCKVGDKFWVIAYKSKVITHVKCSGYVIQEDIPNGIKNKYVWLDSVENPRDYWKLNFDDFNSQCFKTKEEAEQALAEMRGVQGNV